MTGTKIKRLTILHRYFWPQNYPYASMLKDIAETACNCGYEVTVLTTTEGTDKEWNERKRWANDNSVHISALKIGPERGKGVIRKALNSVYFTLWIIFKVGLNHTDNVMVATTPPVITATLIRFVGSIARFRYIYHCQDIHPEAMLINGNLRQGFFYRFLLKLDSHNINGAWKVIVLSEDMKKTFEKRGCRVEHVHVINNFIFEHSNYNFNRSANSKALFLFAGNLGRLQNLDTLMQAIIPLRDRNDVEFHFMGDGIMRSQLEHLKQEHGLHNVSFLGQRNAREAVLAMQQADFGIVSVSPGITSVAYPSKTIMYLGNGLPVLALVDEHTELARFVVGNEAGLVSSPLSVKKITKCIEDLIAKNRAGMFDRTAIAAIAETHFGKKTVLNRFAEVFSS